MDLWGAMWIVDSYLIGAIPFGYLLCYLVRGIDVREYGSKGTGATNVARVLGFRYFIPVFLADALKGFIPVSLVPILIGTHSHIIMVGSGIASIAGHMWPVYLGFQGGKGVSTTLGVLVALSPVFALTALGFWVSIFLLTRYVSLASITAAILLPVFQIIFDPDAFRENSHLTIFLIVAAVFVVWQHRLNLQRLMNGKEPRVIW
jgi:glycerol-3-phosphate acyltransferase PlsY